MYQTPQNPTGQETPGVFYASDPTQGAEEKGWEIVNPLTEIVPPSMTIVPPPPFSPTGHEITVPDMIIDHGQTLPPTGQEIKPGQEIKIPEMKITHTPGDHQ